MSDNINPMVDFGAPEKENTIIKVIGVGGGGGNAVNHMYREGIHDVSFVLCNTDMQALNDSPVPMKLQLGKEGLGAGNKPEKARQAAEESINDIKSMLSDGTKMTFITAGMGGGTGTGAAPVIARVSKELDILTVGIVTIPFRFEGKKKINQALDGVDEMAKHVDALLVINNERLRKIYPELTVLDAFGKADDTLSVAAKSIAEIITNHGLINLDFEDVCQIMRGAGSAHMGVGRASGKDKAEIAAKAAISSPLLESSIDGAERVILNITAPSDIELDEVNLAADMIRACAHPDVNLIFGVAFDDTLDDEMVVTVIATGFELDKNFDIPDYRFKAASSTDTSKKEEKEENDSYKQPDDDDMPFDIMSIFGQRR